MNKLISLIDICTDFPLELYQGERKEGKISKLHYMKNSTSPLFKLYILPTILTFPSCSNFLIISLFLRISSIVFLTLVLATASTYFSFLLLFSPSNWVTSIAGLILLRSPVRLPSSTLSIAPFIAPQAVCPSLV